MRAAKEIAIFVLVIGGIIGAIMGFVWWITQPTSIGQEIIDSIKLGQGWTYNKDDESFVHKDSGMVVHKPRVFWRVKDAPESWSRNISGQINAIVESKRWTSANVTLEKLRSSQANPTRIPVEEDEEAKLVSKIAKRVLKEIKDGSKQK